MKVQAIPRQSKSHHNNVVGTCENSSERTFCLSTLDGFESHFPILSIRSIAVLINIFGSSGQGQDWKCTQFPKNYSYALSQLHRSRIPYNNHWNSALISMGGSPSTTNLLYLILYASFWACNKVWTGMFLKGQERTLGRFQHHIMTASTISKDLNHNLVLEEDREKLASRGALLTSGWSAKIASICFIWSLSIFERKKLGLMSNLDFQEHFETWYPSHSSIFQL